MAKISPVSIKYLIHASFKAQGPVEKPDVIGAIFGQTEGLLGNDLEMRELQKEGKIGRIEVDLQTVDGKSVGEIKVPSALDKSETTIIAATLETIDRIGPTEAAIEITKVEDVRGNKREYIIERAKKLLAGLDSDGDIGEMTRTLRDESRAEKIQEYGAEKLPAGDLSGDEIIVVEGRADVVNLLKNRVNNVIGMNGVKLPAEIAVLGKTKEITLFVDGDRGGKLIAKNVIDNAKIAYVAVAPDGKEVEELTGKEILQSLRKKITVNEYLKMRGFSEDESEERMELDASEAKEKIKKAYNDVAGTKMALFLDDTYAVIKEVPARDVGMALKRMRRSVAIIVMDGSATGGLIKTCEEAGVQFLGATNFSSVEDTSVQLVSL